MASARAAALSAGAAMVRSAENGRRAWEAARNVSLGLVVAFGAAAVAAARFDKGMSEVRAVTGGSAQEMEKLSAAALEAGRTTQYSATQAAKAEAELARAGIATADIVGGALKGTLALAASGQLELGESAIIAAQAMNSFKKSGKDVGHIADVISAGAGKSATNVHDMGMAFRQTSLVANQTGLSLEQTVGTLSLFAQNALTGSDAGTSLKVMLQRLVPQSKEAARMMESLGFSAYDSQGNFVGLTALAGRLQASFAQLTPEARNAAMATIFGADAVRAATILYEAGAKGVDKWVAAVDDTGYATRVAATMTDNLAGDLERLKSALETALISSGSSANTVLREMAQALTAVVNWYAQLSPGVQQTVTALSGLLGVIGLVGAGLMLMLPRIMLVRRELVALGVTAATTRSAMMMLGRMTLVVGGLALVGAGIDSLMDKFKDAPPSVSKLTNSLMELGAKGKASGELAKAFGSDLDGLTESIRRLAHPTGFERTQDVMEYIRKFGDDSAKLTEAKDKIKAIDEALAGLVQSGGADQAATAFKRLAAEAEAGGTSAEKLKTLLPGYTDALAQLDTQSKLSAGGTGKLGDEAALTADALQEERTAAEQLEDALNALNGVNISAAEAEISFRESLAQLTGAVRENGTSLDVASEKGRAVKSAFLDAAQAAAEHAQKVADQKGSVEAGNAVLEKDISLLKSQMKAAGFSEEAIRKLTDAYAALPESAETRIDAKTEGAISDLEAVQGKVRGTKSKTIEVKALTKAGQEALEALGFKIKRTKGKSVTISVPTGSQKSQIAALQRQIDALRGKTVTIRTHHVVTGDTARTPRGQGSQLKYARGGVVDYYADGGIQRGGVRHFAGGAERHVAQFAPAGSWRVWAEPETGGEAYIPLAPSKRVRSRAIAEETVRRLGGRGVAWYADGGFGSYSPSQAPVLGGASDAMDRYTGLVQKLKDAWKELQEAEKALEKLRKAKGTTRKELDAAKRKVAAEREDVHDLDAALGLRKGSKAPGAFNLSSYQKQLGKSLDATEKWRGSLEKIGKRGGEQIRALLESMGEDGYHLVNALAKASDKQFKDIVAKLEKTAGVAKLSLADFNKQVQASSKTNAQFAADLQTLAARGYGDLAAQLAAQGDDAAVAMARQAATGKTKDVAALNASLAKSNTVLTGDDLADSITLLSTLRAKPGRGFAELVAAGLDVATIRALVPRMMDQIKRLPEANRATFLRQLAGQTGVTAMAAGGILTGRMPLVVAGERGPEAYIPLNRSSRSKSLLAQTGQLMGYRMVPAGRYGGGLLGGKEAVREIVRQTTVHLHGAKQTTAEQAHDLARHLAFVG
ncbi:hypothetical protein GCM10010406_52920 [Streptomyces thermolineatus]|uniref:Phage tail tape measure protein domain-containing protein n=1 Tax=Streptomyces thermolineatus TaxID=44033 RepID=A0ABP6A486_9ACTN